ncbi:hypothetical protein HYH03_007126 [Edaphochlamys debaryana]|uniref:MYND-type domain-containing protein n=1 Tax=Edaphochlamys debaryana TaxID=47281 RepID=A0A835Y533_9CHLO|nr:hypothetical protein HYH03_007126 [Edaphochlamys debaryana]|eukprot:KAG2494888.1 hypothetical protein HYH03_007126 [Edaphochlamys debaryana]
MCTQACTLACELAWMLNLAAVATCIVGTALVNGDFGPPSARPPTTALLAKACGADQAWSNKADLPSLVGGLSSLAVAALRVVGVTLTKEVPWAGRVKLWRAEGPGSFPNLRSPAAKSVVEGLERNGLLEELATVVTSQKPRAGADQAVAAQFLLQAALNTCRCLSLLATPADVSIDTDPPPLLQQTMAILRGPRVSRYLDWGLDLMAAEAGLLEEAGGGSGSGARGRPVWLRTPADDVSWRLHLMHAAASSYRYQIWYGTNADAACAMAAEVPRRLARAAEAFVRLYGNDEARSAVCRVRYAAETIRRLLFTALEALDRLERAGQGQRLPTATVAAASVGALAAACCLDLDTDEAAAQLLLEVPRELLGILADEVEMLRPEQQSAAAAAAARARLLTSLDVCARLAARRGGATQLAGFLPNSALTSLLPPVLEVAILKPEQADGRGDGGGGGEAGSARRAREQLGFLVTQAKAARSSAEQSCRALKPARGGRGRAAAAAEAVGAAAVKAAALAEGAFAFWAALADRCVLQPQVCGKQLQRSAISAEAQARRDALRAVLVKCTATAVPSFVRLLDALAAALGGGGGGARAPAALTDAAAATAVTAVTAFGEGCILLQRVARCVPAAEVQRLLGPDLLLRLLAAGCGLVAVLQPLVASEDRGAGLTHTLAAATNSGMEVCAGVTEPLTGEVKNPWSRPMAAVAHATDHPALSPGLWAALRAAAVASAASDASPAAAASTSAASGAGSGASATPDLAPLLRVVQRLEAGSPLETSFSAWFQSLAAMAVQVDSAEAFRRQAASLSEQLMVRLEPDLPAPPYSEQEADVDGRELAAAVAGLRVCANPACAQFEGRAEAEAARKMCGGCRCVRYCSPACQGEHWQGAHKGECKTLAAEAAAAKAGADVYGGGAGGVQCVDRWVYFRGWPGAGGIMI